MSDLKTAITCLEIAVAAMALLVLGDYLGYKFGHMRTAIAIGIITLILIVAFAIYAAIHIS